MSIYGKKFIAWILSLVMILSLLPVISLAAEETTEDLWEEILAFETSQIVPKRGGKITSNDYAALSDEVAAIVMASDSYVEGTCTYDGENAFFFWENTNGEVCAYSPRLRAQMRNAELSEEEVIGTTETVSYATKGGSSSSVNVAVFQPYYGIDTSFTTQYKTEGESIAAATGGTSTLYKTTNATLDNIAKAMESCGVVIFDSHGDTDFYVKVGTDSYGDPLYDCTSQANTSYICLQTDSTWTAADRVAVKGTYNTYYHAYYAGYYGSIKYYCVDGTAIANHMTKQAPNSLLWMAICLGMATDGLHAPLRKKGVEVLYGYSQSVTFSGDYAYEKSFWNTMRSDKTVAEAIATAKNNVGIRDPYVAASDFPAYPIVVSSEDSYPGQGNVDKAQTVKSTWTLFPHYSVTAVSNNTAYGTVSLSGNTITATPKTGYYTAGYTILSGSAEVTQNSNVFTVSPLSNCTIQVNFAPKSAVSVTLSSHEGNTSVSGYTGDSIALPSPVAPEGYQFVGWTDAPMADSTTPPNLWKTEYPLTQSTTLYALYSYIVDGDGTTSYILQDITEISPSDEFVITMEYVDETIYAMSNGNGVTSAPSAVTVTATDGKLDQTPAENLLWNIGGSAGAYIFYPKGSTASWLYCTGTNNGVRIGTNSANTFYIDSATGYLRHNGTSRYIGVYRNNPDWRCYTSSTTNIGNQTLGFYVKRQNGTTHYTTNIITTPTIDQGISIGEQLYLESDLTMNFRIKESQLTAYDISTAYLVVERDIYATDGTMEVDVQTLTDFTLKDNRLVFVYNGIAASQMNDEIRVTLYIKDSKGREYQSAEKVTTITLYAKTLLETMPTGYPKLYTVLMDMLNYGTAAQNYFNRHANAPANEAYPIFADYAPYASEDLTHALENLSSQSELPNASATIAQALDLGTRIGVTYKVALPAGVNAENAILVVKDSDGNELERIVLSSGTVDNRGRYVVNFYGNASREMRRVVNATVYVDGTAISNTYFYSISTYAYDVANTANMPQNLIDLTRLMVIYGDSAAAYFG